MDGEYCFKWVTEGIEIGSAIYLLVNRQLHLMTAWSLYSSIVDWQSVGHS
jgi:hypothetical protein